MSTFVESFLWGTGLSLGLCVGLVAWAFLRHGVHKVLGIDDQWETQREYNRESLDCLKERNRLTVVTNEIIERIACEFEQDDLDDDSETRKHS